MGLDDLPNPKWAVGTGRQVILKSDFEKIESAILESQGISTGPPALTWVDAGNVKIAATADSPAKMLLTGFPNVLHPGQTVLGAADGSYRVATSQVNLALATDLWGTEKASQFYLIYALSAGAAFSLKAMPFLRVKSQAGQDISLGTNAAPATGIGYGFDTDELAGALIYMLSGVSKGLLRTISANNNDNGTAGVITYAGGALSLAQGDSFTVLPNEPFVYLAHIFNNSSSNILNAIMAAAGGYALYLSSGLFLVPPGIWQLFSALVGGGGGGAGYPPGGGGAASQLVSVPVTPWEIIPITVGTPGSGTSAAGGYDGTPSSLGSYANAPAGKGGGTTGGESGQINSYNEYRQAAESGVNGDGSSGYGGRSGLYLGFRNALYGGGGDSHTTGGNGQTGGGGMVSVTY